MIDAHVTAPLEGASAHEHGGDERLGGSRPGRRRAGGGGGAPPSRPPSTGWWRFGFPVAMAALVVAVPVLLYVGARTLLESNDGQLIDRVTDPAAPGWEAIVEPTPTFMVAMVDATDQLAGVTVLVVAGEGTGAVVQVPVDTLVPIDDGTRQIGEISLGFQWQVAGLDGVRGSVGELFNLAFQGATAIRPVDWPIVLDPVAPLSVDSPDPVIDELGQELFPRGTIELGADQVSTYVSTRAPVESELARLERVSALWRAWLGAISGQGAQGAQGAPTPVDQGLGFFVANLGVDLPRFLTLPVDPGEDPEGREVFRPDEDDVDDLVDELVPFPRGAPGRRPTVKVLDGTGQLDHGVDAAALLGAAGAQVEVIGNASDFEATTTEIVYYDAAQAGDAEQLRQALGVGDVEKSDQKSAIDVTVVLGRDVLDLAGARATVPGTGPSGATGG